MSQRGTFCCQISGVQFLLPTLNPSSGSLPDALSLHPSPRQGFSHTVSARGWPLTRLLSSSIFPANFPSGNAAFTSPEAYRPQVFLVGLSAPAFLVFTKLNLIFRPQITCNPAALFSDCIHIQILKMLRPSIYFLSSLVTWFYYIPSQP